MLLLDIRMVDVVNDGELSESFLTSRRVFFLLFKKKENTKINNLYPTFCKIKGTAFVRKWQIEYIMFGDFIDKLETHYCYEIYKLFKKEEAFMSLRTCFLHSKSQICSGSGTLVASIK